MLALWFIARPGFPRLDNFMLWGSAPSVFPFFKIEKKYIKTLVFIRLHLKNLLFVFFLNRSKISV